MITTQYNSFIRIYFEDKFDKNNLQITNLFFEKYDCSKINIMELITFCEVKKDVINDYFKNKRTLFNDQIIILIMYFIKYKQNTLVTKWFLDDRYLQEVGRGLNINLYD